MVDQYGQLNGDRNMIHYDRTYALKAGFSDRVVHGAITVAMVHEACREYFGASWFTRGRLQVKFVAPVLVGETIITSGREIETDPDKEGGWRKVEVVCTNQDGTTVLVGEAVCEVDGT